MSLRLKICCIRSIEEAQVAVDHGAHAVGLVSAMPTGPGVIPDVRIAEIAAALPEGVASFLLTSRQSAREIADQHAVCGTTTVQIVDRLVEGTHADLRAALPGIEIVQVIHVMDETAVDQAMLLDRQVDGLLLDSGNPSLAAKELGGTGRTHDWSVSARLCARVAAPVLLAGGLSADNVVAAVERVRPAGIDVCSGVRTDDRLDDRKLGAMLGNLRTAGLLA